MPLAEGMLPFFGKFLNLTVNVIDIPRGFCAESSVYFIAAEFFLASSISETRCEKNVLKIIGIVWKYCKLHEQYKEKMLLCLL